MLIFIHFLKVMAVETKKTCNLDGRLATVLGFFSYLLAVCNVFSYFCRQIEKNLAQYLLMPKGK